VEALPWAMLQLAQANRLPAESRQVGIATECRPKRAAVLVGQAVSTANCEIETLAGETACPTSHASQRGGNAKVKPAGSCSTEKAKGFDLEAGNEIFVGHARGLPRRDIMSGSREAIDDRNRFVTVAAL
jgi:hypothetical protein